MGLGQAECTTPKAAGESLRLARELAHEARELVRRGLDPIDEREQRRALARQEDASRKLDKARQALTLARAARNYHERVIEPTRSSKHAAQWISSLENHVPHGLWHAPMADVTAPALLAALSGLKPHARARNVNGSTVPETLRRIRQRLDAVFEDAIFHGHLAHNPAAAIRRKLGETLPAKQAGKLAALAYGEAPAFMQRLRTWPGTAARCLEFAILTVARTGEAIGATWPEIDLQARTWLVPAGRMKGSEAHLVPLSDRALDVLRQQQGLHDLHVFPSPMKPDATLSNMAMLTLLGRMTMRDRTTVHGLCRATFSTWANETGAGRPDVIEACLAHEETNRVRASYNRARFNEERRALLAAWADFLARPAAPVVELQRGAA